jgi:hypothetical protein
MAAARTRVQHQQHLANLSGDGAKSARTSLLSERNRSDAACGHEHGRDLLREG